MTTISLNRTERLLQIILSPQVSEKATYIGEKNNQIILKVIKSATKIEIKNAVELLWKDQKITVDKVQVCNVKGKKKRFGRFMGKRGDWKKAYVSIKDGKEINFAELSKGDSK